MKGQLLHFENKDGTGWINGSDGNRYSFNFNEWKSQGMPVVGVEVDFLPDNGKAMQIVAMGVTHAPTPVHATTPEYSRVNNTAPAANANRSLIYVLAAVSLALLGALIAVFISSNKPSGAVATEGSPAPAPVAPVVAAQTPAPTVVVTAPPAPTVVYKNAPATTQAKANVNIDSLRLRRNEIYARHGYIFKDAALRNYFMSQPWYSPRYNNVDGMLTAAEKREIADIKAAEKGWGR